jgi:hypothetical protein
MLQRMNAIDTKDKFKEQKITDSNRQALSSSMQKNTLRNGTTFKEDDSEEQSAAN